MLIIYKSQKWELDWSIIDKNFIKGCEKILTSTNEFIGLIYYSLGKNPMIGKFETFENKKRQGYGKAIINQFLKEHPCHFELFPFSEENVFFWKKCGFEGNHLGMIFDDRRRL